VRPLVYMARSTSLSPLRCTVSTTPAPCDVSSKFTTSCGICIPHVRFFNKFTCRISILRVVFVEVLSNKSSFGSRVSPDSPGFITPAAVVSGPLLCCREEGVSCDDTQILEKLVFFLFAFRYRILSSETIEGMLLVDGDDNDGLAE
jgi:hypothetical protein